MDEDFPEPDAPSVGHGRLKYDHGLYTTFVVNGEPKHYLVAQFFSDASLRRQLTKARFANRSRVYWTTDPNIS